MKKVFICSPLKGDYKKNRRNALKYCRLAYEKGVLPFAPHLYFPQFLDDTKLAERLDGMKMGQEFMFAMQELWVIGDTISNGMQEEISLAKILDIPVKYFDKYMEEVHE